MRGNAGGVAWLGSAIALIVLGILLGIVVFPFGFGLLLIGVVLLIAYFVGAGRRAAERSE